ncbi:hypothetical protein K504DRAFT_470937 [Pleomassaria siparia CBS 279.74]|uniref:VWFA domain-containing protein n=1 Tax=Pleomassaria siparia CBS 279.74 TaxID=1314801 RepID=A0A6G1K347_9PLEO|nr:hypothetical protein K504DRAFT_470937 [Pleomassaria siparia CBS 279.74]
MAATSAAAAATTTTTSGLVPFSHHHHHLAALFPPPLHIQKKHRRSTFRRQILRKSSHIQSAGDEVYGPLDDIIDEITGDIWRAPPPYTFDPSLFEWPNPLKASATWTVTPLPVSRIPSDVPLTIRKQRNSRSTASGSTFSDVMSQSRDTSQNQPSNNHRVGSSPSPPDTLSNTRWLSFDLSESQTGVDNRPESSIDTVCTNGSTSPQAFKNLFRKTEDITITNSQSASRSRIRKLVSPLLRRGTSNGNSGASSTSLVHVAPAVMRPGGVASANTGPEDKPDSFKAWMTRNANSSQMINYLPSPPKTQHANSLASCPIPESDGLPTTLKASIRIVSEVKLLSTQHSEEFWVAVEIEGMLHNRRPLQDTSLDFVFVIDNGYYVSRDGLSQAVDVAVGALNFFNNSDRVSLYATHCTHETVSGTVPELMYPLRQLSKESKDELRDMMLSIGHQGAQKWSPVRPNPSITDVVIAVAKSLDNRNPRTGRTHILLLSPAASNMHSLFKTHPELRVHHVNPAVIPAPGLQRLGAATCSEICCANFALHNSNHYQSVPGVVKQIIRYARSESPVGDVTNVHAEIRTQKGCKVITVEGSKDVRRLRPGQVHSFFIRVRVTSFETQEVDLNKEDPVFQSCLNSNYVRQDLQNAAARGGSKVHLLTVQVTNQTSLHDSTTWQYSEEHLFAIKTLGHLARPLDVSAEVYRRALFFMMSRLDPNEAGEQIQELGGRLPVMDPGLKKNVERLQKEIAYHKEVVEYESNSRQTLSICHGPVHVPNPHEWVITRW